MSYIEKVKSLELSYYEQLKMFMESNKFDEVILNKPFKVYVEVMYEYNDYGYEQRIARSVLIDGTIITDTDELLIKELDLYEMAHLLDILEKGEYRVVTNIDH